MKSFEDRRQLDTIQTYKNIKGKDKVETLSWFNLVGDNAIRLTRNTGYSANLVASRSTTDLRKNFFSSRVINT